MHILTAEETLANDSDEVPAEPEQYFLGGI